MRRRRLQATLMLMLIVLTFSPCLAIDLPAVVRGSGTVLLMPEPGPLEMTFAKRRRPGTRRDSMRITICSCISRGWTAAI